MFREGYAEVLNYMNDESKLAYLEALVSYGTLSYERDICDEDMPLDARIAYTLAKGNVARFDA